MRILMVCKRQYTGQDLLDDHYGRLHAIPSALAGMGHRVTVVASSYRRKGAVDREEFGLRWIGVDAWPWPRAVPARWLQLARELRPQVIVASSDAPHLIVGEWLARRLGVPVVLDFYDDYEAFGLSRLPGLRALLRAATGRAAARVAVSRSLARILAARIPAAAPAIVIGNGIPDGFVPAVSRQEARAALGLPGDQALVGIAGALLVDRGIRDLFEAFELLRTKRPALRLVVAGPRDSAAGRLIPSGTLDLGQIPHGQVAWLFRALNVGVICNRDGAFARACHPMKLVEMAACGLPAVAADLGEVSQLLAHRPDCRFPPGDPATLAQRIAAQLDAPRPLDPGLAEFWPTLAQRYAQVIHQACRQ